MAGMKRVLLVANTDWYLYNFRLSLARLLRHEGFEVLLASPPGDFVPRLREAGFVWHPLIFDRRSLWPPKEALAFLRFLQLYRRVRPDLVHHFTIKPVLYGSLAARLLRVPAVVNAVTGLGYLYLSQGWRERVVRRTIRPLYRWVLLRPGVRLIFENPSDRDFFLLHGFCDPQRAVVIPGVGVDLERFRPSREPPGRPTVVLASRLLWDKGVGEFVEAARSLKRQGCGARFVLVGEPDPGNPASIPEAVLRRWVAEGVVEWWGHRDDMPEVLARAHVVTLPSYGEGVPTVLLEAAACARPIVATDVPGCREVVRHGLTGLLVPPRDPGALAQALKRLIDDPEARRRMGLAGRALIEASFDQGEINRATLEVYLELMGRMARAQPR